MQGSSQREHIFMTGPHPGDAQLGCWQMPVALTSWVDQQCLGASKPNAASEQLIADHTGVLQRPPVSSCRSTASPTRSGNGRQNEDAPRRTRVQPQRDVKPA